MADMRARRPDSNRLFIRGAIERPGALRRQLGIPRETRIPTTLLAAIRDAPIGTRITNPTQTGRRRITVTRLLKQRAVLALTLRSF